MGKRSRSRSKKRKSKLRSSDDESDATVESQSSKGKKKPKVNHKDKKEKPPKKSGRKSSSKSDESAKSSGSRRSQSSQSRGKDAKKDKDKKKDRRKQKDKRDEVKKGKQKKDKEKHKKTNAKPDRDEEKKDRPKDKAKTKGSAKEAKDRDKDKKKHERRRSSSQSKDSRREKKHSRSRKRSRNKSESSEQSKGGLKNARRQAARGWDAQTSGEALVSSSQALAVRPVTTASPPAPTPPGGFRIQSFEEIMQQLKSQGSSTAQVAPASLALPARPLSSAIGSREADYGRRDDMFPEPNPEILSRANMQAKKEEEDGRALIRKTGQVPNGPPGLPTGVLVINQKFVDFLVGPSGQSLAAINYAAGVTIVLDQSHMWEGYTIARIYGAEANSDRAKLAIEFKTNQWIPRTSIARKAGPTGGPVSVAGWQSFVSEPTPVVGTGITRLTSTSVAL